MSKLQLRTNKFVMNVLNNKDKRTMRKYIKLMDNLSNKDTKYKKIMDKNIKYVEKMKGGTCAARKPNLTNITAQELQSVS